MIKKIFLIIGLIPVILLFLLSGRTVAQSKTDKVFQKLELELGLGSVYDNNILKYSDYYLAKFLNREDSGRFHINTSDGLILDQSIKLTPTFHLFGKTKTILEGKYTRQDYLNNKIKTWNQVSFELQQFIIGKLSINISYSYLPKFYVRHYRDDDWVNIYGYTPETFQPFEFSKNEYGIWIQNSFFKNKNTRLRLSLDYGTYYYNEHFTEYDSKNLTYSADLYQSLWNNKLKFELGYHFITSNAKGYDDPQETKDNSDDSDPSYNADEYCGVIKLPLPRVYKRAHNISFNFIYKRSCFTSDHYLELDPLHAGRYDDLYKIKINYEIQLLNPLAVSGFYYWYKQNSNTRAAQNKTLVSQEKDYKQQLCGLTFTYIFKDIKFSRSKKTN